MSISLAQAACSTTGGFTTTVTLTPTAGNMLYAMVSSGHTTPTLSIGDNAGNSWNIAQSLHNYAAGLMSAQSWYAIGVSGASTIVTGTTSDNTDWIVLNVCEISGASVLDKVAVADNPGTGGAGTLQTGTTATTTAAAEILIATFASSTGVSSWAAGSGYTIPAGGSQVPGGAQFCSALEYQVVAATGAYQASITPGIVRNTIGIIATFKASGGATAGLFEPSPLTGIGTGGPFFRNPIGRHSVLEFARRKPLKFARRDRIFVPERLAA